MKVRLSTVAISVAALALLGGLAAALVVWLGVYDVTATNQHTRPVYTLLDYALRRSVQADAEAVPPADLAAPRRVLAGAAHYRQHCVQCHGAPGVAPAPLAFGLTPAPANLLPAGREWKAAELFHVVKHGIKSTGMPAWIFRLSDQQVWDVVAFLRAMPGLSVPDYARLVSGLPPAPAAAGVAAAIPAQQAPPSAGAAPGTPPVAPAALRPGDAEAGRLATARYLCVTCHVIPGFVDAKNHVGPPLAGAGTRAFIAGVLPNTRDNMVRWLMDPQGIDPLSAMPPLGLAEQDAHDIAAFMATLDAVKAR